MSRLAYRLLEDLTSEEQAAACRDTGHSLGALEDVFLYRPGARWRCRSEVLVSHVRGGHVIAPRPPQAPTRRLEVVIAEDAGDVEEGP